MDVECCFHSQFINFARSSRAPLTGGIARVGVRVDERATGRYEDLEKETSQMGQDDGDQISAPAIAHLLSWKFAKLAA